METITERSIEKMLKKKVEQAIPGAKCMKFISPGYTGVPDRVILLPYGVTVFVELKRPGAVPRIRQKYVQEQLRKLGFPVIGCVDSPEAVKQAVHVCVLLTGMVAWLHNEGRMSEVERVMREHGV